VAGVSIEDCERALANLQQPDKYSRSPEHEGRRIESIDGGWLILNRVKYRDKMSVEDRREQNRIRQQRHRAKTDVTPNVTPERDMSPSSQQDRDRGKENLLSSEPSGSDVVPTTPHKKKQNNPTLEAERLALLLRDEILHNKPDCRITEKQLRKWAVTAGRMLRLDGRTEESVARFIQWVQHDEFWLANVLSMDTLREKFDQLELKCERDTGGRKAESAETNRPKPIPPDVRMRQACAGNE
jgi:hypothetical protein